MATEKSTNIFINLEALFQARLNSEKKELRQEILEEQLGELLQSEAVQEANLHDFLEQLKHAGKELWTLASSMPLIEIARFISGADLLEQKLKNKRKPRTTPAKLEDLKAQVLAFLKSSIEGQSSEQIQKALSLEPSVLKPVLLKLRTSKQVTTQGEKRATRYSAA